LKKKTKKKLMKNQKEMMHRKTAMAVRETKRRYSGAREMRLQVLRWRV